MSYYSTQQQLTNRVSEKILLHWADDDNDDVVDTDVVNHALKWAYDEINQCLAELYASYLPFTAVTLPGVINNTSTTFAAYILVTRSQPGWSTDSQIYTKEYDEARERLKKIADGEWKLQLGDGTIAVPDSGSGSNRISPSGVEPIYSRKTLDSYSNFLGEKVNWHSR